MAETALYRFFDGEDTLLYVGISANPGVRLLQHREDKPLRRVRVIELEWFDTAGAAKAAERKAIAYERPLWNVQHRRKPRECRATRAISEPLPPVVEARRDWPEGVPGPVAPYHMIAICDDGTKMWAHHTFPPSRIDLALRCIRPGDIVVADNDASLPQSFWQDVIARGGYQA